VAEQLDGRSARRAQGGRAALATWQGPHARTFEALWEGTLRNEAQLAAALRETAAAIDRAADAAREEQRRRERIRAELAAEARRRAAAQALAAEGRR
jgi:uncharacterized protein YukE